MDHVRQDIQFLRGFAVLAVLFYHADLFPISGGFLGVDIFFVISGYLITSIILRDLDAGRFSFAQFYLRRAKRLLPAAYSTLIFTTLAGYAFLTEWQWSDYVKQLVGTVTFTANLVLPFQTGYFESAAEGKPLLHAWSLSLEEQYYLITPLLLFSIASRWRPAVFLLGIAVSFITCVFFVSFPFTYWRLPTIDSQNMAFFLLPTRAWELLAGSLLAWYMSRSPLVAIPRIVKFTALFALCGVVFFPVDSVHPRGDALLAVIATALMLAGDSSWLPSNVATRAIAKVGDWSYSLYLVHWPLFAFAHNAFLGEVPIHARWLLAIAAIILAYLQYELVEQRFRYRWKVHQRRAFQWLAGASFLVVVTPVPAMVSKRLTTAADMRDFSYLRAPNVGLHPVCAQGREFAVKGSCATSEAPAFAVWGDSYAMHLIPGLRADPIVGNSIIQLTKAACAPILGVASIDSNYDEDWARECLAFNEKVIDFIGKSQSIKYVILSSSFSGYLDDGNLLLFHRGNKMAGNRSIAIDEMVKTIELIRLRGKTPIVVTPPPRAGFNVGDCWERKETGLVVLGRTDCNIDINEYRSYQQGLIASLREVQDRTGVDIVWLEDFFCGKARCTTAIGSTSLYRDGGHLTVPGSKWLVSQLDISGRLLRREQAAGRP